MNGETEHHDWIEQWAQWLKRSIGSPTASLLVDLIRPLGFLGSQALFVAQPVLTGLVASSAIEHAATLLDTPELLDQLSASLEKES